MDIDHEEDSSYNPHGVELLPQQKASSFLLSDAALDLLIKLIKMGGKGIPTLLHTMQDTREFRYRLESELDTSKITAQNRFPLPQSNIESLVELVRHGGAGLSYLLDGEAEISELRYRLGNHFYHGMFVDPLGEPSQIYIKFLPTDDQTAGKIIRSSNNSVKKALEHRHESQTVEHENQTVAVGQEEEFSGGVNVLPSYLAGSSRKLKEPNAKSSAKVFSKSKEPAIDLEVGHFLDHAFLSQDEFQTTTSKRQKLSRPKPSTLKSSEKGKGKDRQTVKDPLTL